jgi:hypothetical protein
VPLAALATMAAGTRTAERTVASAATAWSQVHQVRFGARAPRGVVFEDG